MVLPQPLEEMERYIQQEGRLSPYDASRFRKVLALFAREARKKRDVVLEQEVERLQRRIDATTRAPPVHALALERKRLPRVDFSDANRVWEQISLEEREALLKRIGFSAEDAAREKYPRHVPLEDTAHDQLTIPTGTTWEEMLRIIAAYPRSEERHRYLREQRGGLRRIRLYRRRWY